MKKPPTTAEALTALDRVIADRRANGMRCGGGLVSNAAADALVAEGHAVPRSVRFDIRCLLKRPRYVWLDALESDNGETTGWDIGSVT